MRDFERYAPAIALFHAGAAMMAVGFGLEVLDGGSPVTPELYGPRVYAIPALAWVAIQLGGSVAAFSGSVFGGKIGAALVALGGLVCGLMYSALAVMAADAELGTIVEKGAIFVFAPVSFTTALVAIRYLRRGQE